jgi:hypothetical protein
MAAQCVDGYGGSIAERAILDDRLAGPDFSAIVGIRTVVKMMSRSQLKVTSSS